MIIREYQEGDKKAVEGIFALYWTDPVFLEELSDELESCGKDTSQKDRGFYVVEDNNTIEGIIGYKKLPDYLKPYSITDNPIELYVVASKEQRRGVGGKLKESFLEEVRRLGFGEVLLYSPNSHSDSWGFHDTLGFERVGEVTPPKDDIGHVWRKVL